MSSDQKYRELLRTLLVKSPSHTEFLLKAFGALKALNPHFNYSYVALHSGLTRSFVRQVILGKKNLSLKALDPFCRVFKLDDDLEKYFQTLYKLDQARESKEGSLIKKFSAELAVLRKSITTKKKSESKHLTSLLWPRVYASLGSEEKGSALQEILHRSKVGKEEVLHILKELEENHLVKQNVDTRFYPVFNHIDMGKSFSFKRIFLNNHQLLGEKAEKDFGKKDGLFFSSVTCVKKEDLPELKEEFRNLLLKFIDRCEEAEGSTTVTLLAGMFENG